jgi:hypothetical protein
MPLLHRAFQALCSLWRVGAGAAHRRQCSVAAAEYDRNVRLEVERQHLQVNADMRCGISELSSSVGGTAGL